MSSNKNEKKLKNRTLDNVRTHKYIKDILTCYEKCLNCMKALQLETNESDYLIGNE